MADACMEAEKKEAAAKLRRMLLEESGPGVVADRAYFERLRKRARQLATAKKRVVKFNAKFL